MSAVFVVTKSLIPVIHSGRLRCAKVSFLLNHRSAEKQKFRSIRNILYQSCQEAEILEKFRNINREFILTHRFNYLYTFLSLISSCVQGDQLLLSFNDLSARIDKIISAYLKEVEDIVESNKEIDPYIGENINFDEIVDA